jgi:hypothetical protein
VRATRPGGAILVTTPNRLTFSPHGRLNPFHTREFTAAELVDLISGCGAVVETMCGLHAGPRLRAYDAAHRGSFAEAQLAQPPQDWGEGLVRDVVAVGTTDFSVSAADVDECLDLVLVARRPA